MDTGEPHEVFFAYPSQSGLLAETMRTAASGLARQSGLAVTTWQDLTVDGRVIISEVLAAIDRSTVIVADLTDMNSNVLFEVGYALAAEKHLLLALDTSDASAQRNWKDLGVLTSIGYTPYEGSSRALVSAFMSARPDHRADRLWEDLLVAGGAGPRRPRSMFYVPLGGRADSGKAIDRSLMARKDLSVVSADEEEQGLAPLSWYAVQIYESSATLVHLRGPQRARARMHNARASLFAGIAHALKLPTLLVAEETFEPPLDYKDLLFRYSTAKQVRNKTEHWLDSLPGESESRAVGKRKLSAELPFRRFGEYVAENEQDELLDYFVETGQYQSVLDSQTAVFVGRKGTGKTANMLTAAGSLASDRRNLVAVIKPSGYEFESLLAVFARLPTKDVADYLVDGFWRYMLMVEIASAAVREADGRPAGISTGSSMDSLRAYLERYPGGYEANFAVRLERLVDELQEGLTDVPSSVQGFEAWFNERLHISSIAELRKLTGAALHDVHRVAVLVDNLDKAWERSADRDQQARVILGLLAAIGRVERDFRRDDSWHSSVNVTLAVFLRADIFDHVKEQAREPDKILTLQVAWEDAELLARVIEDRYVAQHAGAMPEDLWTEFFTPTIGGRPTREFLLWRSLPRPRDLVYLCNACVLNATNRRHQRIEEADVRAAEDEYSRFAFDALRVEGSSTDELDELLISFAGSDPIMTEGEVLALIRSAGIASNEDDLLGRLLRANFLGIRVSAEGFDYPRSEESERVARARARRVSSQTQTETLYTVHPAFRPYLGVADEEGAAAD